jgi:Transposase
VLFVGWDWASTSHAVTILDQGGTLVDHWTLGHTEDDLDTILARLAAHGDPADLPVAIERSDGLIVARLLAGGHPVVPISPGAFHAARPRWGAAGAKSDPGDSYKLATTCAPTATGCAGWNHPTRPPANCRPWYGCATTTSRPRPPPVTNSVRCWTPTGPAPSMSSAGSPPRSPWRS